MAEKVMLQIVVDGTVMATLVASPKVFSTGSTGYFAFGKVGMPDGTRVQISCNLVTLGTRPVTK